MKICRTFIVKSYYTKPARTKDIANALARRKIWLPGDPKIDSRLIVLTEHMVPLTLRLEDTRIANQPDTILERFKERKHIASQLKSAEKHLKTSRKLLEEVGKHKISAVLQQLYPTVIDFLVLATRGEHKNPVHHSLVVLENATRIGLGEGLSDSDLKVLCVSAFIHDIGCCASVRERILPAHIEAEKDDFKRDQMITQAILFRSEHMEKGKEIADKLLSSNTLAPYFTGPEKSRIKMLVATHDNPGIENFMQEPCGQWLFFSQEHLALLLRAADRLWMLTPEGLETDLERDNRKGKLVDPHSHLQHNIDEHRKEREAYDIIEDAAKKYGFIGNTLHISPTGYALHNIYIERTCRIYGIDTGEIDKRL